MCHQIVSTPKQLKTNPPISWQSRILQVSPLLSYEGEGLGARPVPGAKLDGEEYAVSPRENAGLGNRISQQICSYQAPFACVFYKVKDAFCSNEGMQIFVTPTTNTKTTLPRVVGLDTAGSPAHFNCDSQVGWAMLLWLKNNPLTESGKTRPGGILTCWLCELKRLYHFSHPGGNDPIWLVFCKVAQPPTSSVDWLSSTCWVLQEANAWTLMVLFWCLESNTVGCSSPWAHFFWGKSWTWRRGSGWKLAWVKKCQIHK